MTHLEIFDSHMENDFEEILHRLQDIETEFNEPESVFNLLMSTVQGTGAATYFLSILQHLLVIRDDFYARYTQWTCECTCTHAQAHMHTSTCTHLHARIHMHTCTHAQVHMHTHTCTHPQAHMHKHTCTHPHAHMHKYTCTHPHMHTCTSTQNRAQVHKHPH